MEWRVLPSDQVFGMRETKGGELMPPRITVKLTQVESEAIVETLRLRATIAGCEPSERALRKVLYAMVDKGMIGTQKDKVLV